MYRQQPPKTANIVDRTEIKRISELVCLWNLSVIVSISFFVGVQVKITGRAVISAKGQKNNKDRPEIRNEENYCEYSKLLWGRSRKLWLPKYYGHRHYLLLGHMLLKNGKLYCIRNCNSLFLYWLQGHYLASALCSLRITDCYYWPWHTATILVMS